MNKNSRGLKKTYQITETWTIKTSRNSPPQQQEQQHDGESLEPAAAVADLPSTSNKHNLVKQVNSSRLRGGFKSRFVVKLEASNSVEEECCVAEAERVEEVQEEKSELNHENVNFTTASELEKIECNEDLVDAVENSFGELRLHMEEDSNLSDDQLSLNLQLQQDELLALESIYGDNIC